MKESTSVNTAIRHVFHLLPNAHLDPVWLWDWREGLGEGLTTVRTILDLMEEFPELTFFRGEASIYEHIEKADPVTFRRVVDAVESGRWDLVGGTYVQPDSNLASTESLCRHFEVGLKYFSERFGRVPRVAWQADSFGHTPGFPEVLSSFGMESFAFTRPQRAQFPMESPAFWWRGRGEGKVLCYRQHWLWYCSERYNMEEILDVTLRGASTQPFRNVGVFMGMGNHGGGPTRRHIQDVRDWAAAHPEVEVRYSTLHGFFDHLEGELAALPLGAVPSFSGDMGYCLRGCYSSALRLKAAHRRSEAALADAERTHAAIGAALPGGGTAALDSPWKGVLFNTFHDILPGSSIERALDDQIALSGHILRRSQEVSFEALTRLGRAVETSLPPARREDGPRDVAVLVWNPLPKPFTGLLEIEASVDYRPLHGHSADVGSLPLFLGGPDGERPAFQEIPTEHFSMRGSSWRKRLVIRSEIPPLGWKVFRLGFRLPDEPLDGAVARPGNPIDPFASAIACGAYRVEVTPEKRVRILRDGVPVLRGGGEMELNTVEDIWGSWGGMDEEMNAIVTEKVLHRWTVSDCAVLESGPERFALWTRWRGGSSWVDLTYHIGADEGGVSVAGRLLWNERSARLKLVLPSEGPLEMQVPAGVAARDECGHLPCGRWVRRGVDARALGFVSDIFSDIDATDDALNVTLVRASRYADDVPTPADVRPWAPAMDAGEFRFRFLLMPGHADLERCAEDLLSPPVAMCVDPHSGVLPTCGSLASVSPAQASLLALRCEGNGLFTARVQNVSDLPAQVLLRLGGLEFDLGHFSPWQIRTKEISIPSTRS